MELRATATRLAPGLLRYCLGKTGDPTLAEEISQEALMALVRRWRKLGPPENPEAFLFAVARRRAARQLWRRRWFRPLDARPNCGAELVAGEAPPGPDHRAEQRSQLRAVHAALTRLSRRDREVLLLVAAGEVNPDAAAKVLAISPSALRMRLHRARQRLVQLLEKDHARVSRRQAGERV